MTTAQNLRDYYSALPYNSFSYIESAPEQMEAVATLFRTPGNPAPSAKVLEVGCASGGNLIPFAMRHPNANCVGIDLSENQIADAIDHAKRLGLENIRFLEADFTAIDQASLGLFDYVICHGVYSWIPAEQQHKLLKFCNSVLAPGGITYVSYNTYPGWKTREVVRDAMLLHARDKSDLQERLSHARAMIGFLRQSLQKDSIPARTVEETIYILDRTGDDYLAHDYLEPYNNPCYFEQFVDRAVEAGFDYLGEARPERMNASNYEKNVSTPLVGTFGHDQVKLEQYLDFVSNRSFRQTLLVSSGHGRTVNHDISAADIDALHFSVNLPCQSGPTTLDDSVQHYGLPGGPAIASGNPLVKAILDELAASWPRTCTKADLARRVSLRFSKAPDFCEPTVDHVLRDLVSRGLARIRVRPVQTGTATGERPSIAIEVVRMAAALRPEDRFVSDLWNDTIELDPIERMVYPLLDGQNNRAQIIERLSATGAGDNGLTSPEDLIDQALSLARSKGLTA